jgi:hypothetical protein
MWVFQWAELAVVLGFALVVFQWAEPPSIAPQRAFLAFFFESL